MEFAFTRQTIPAGIQQISPLAHGEHSELLHKEAFIYVEKICKCNCQCDKAGTDSDRVLELDQFHTV